ncbi:MAG TPA: IMP dehydrogenase, partial [Bacteroidales bacterium]|nr:IMP dehydrogenase [Bacteroidales bacterium]
MSLDSDKFKAKGLTFDDVLLVPDHSTVLPRETNLNTSFSKNISLRIPIVSAAMDTVTESKMAIAIAQEGGIGVIHKNLNIQVQANEVHKVKRAENGLIPDPITLHKEAKVRDALNIMAEYS